MHFNISHIIEGWRNELIPPKELKEAIEKLSDHRLSFCKECIHNTTPKEINRWTSRCDVCGCFLKAKSKSVDEHCPLDPPKWQAVGTLEEDEAIQNALKNEPGT